MGGKEEGGESVGEKRLDAISQGPKKLENFWAQPPPTFPRNGYARIQNIMHGAV
jgi:hypothetical protein